MHHKDMDGMNRRQFLIASGVTGGAALAGLQEQYARDERERTRTISGSSTEATTTPVSGFEREGERDSRRTITSRVRMSLDRARDEDLPPLPVSRRDHRMTVTDIFARS